MKVSTIIAYLEQLASPSLQENYDNSTLMVGDKNTEINSVLICLDITEDVVDEAIQKGSGLIISHHPVIFSGLKSLTGKNYVERVVIKAIKNDIALYAFHTNLDHVSNGVNRKIGEKIGLNNLKILKPIENSLLKLVFYCPLNQTEKVRQAIFKEGAGHIGGYDCCSFSSKGKGTFRAGTDADPYVGEKGELHEEEESRVEVVLPFFLEKQVINALLMAHPYEEVAYDVFELKNKWKEVGSGMIGELPEEMELENFLDTLKVKIETDCIRHTKKVKEKVKKIALCGGSGSFLLKEAIKQKADVFVTGDYKYHQFFDADRKIVIADVGHFESEQHTPELIQDYFKEKLPNFATYLSKINTNPINYR